MMRRARDVLLLHLFERPAQYRCGALVIVAAATLNGVGWATQ